MLLGSLHLNNNQQERPSLPSQKSSHCEIKERYNEGGVDSILLALLDRENYQDAKISIVQGQEGYDVLVGDSSDNRVMVDRQE